MEELGISENFRKMLGMSHRNKIILTKPSRPLSFYCDHYLRNDDVRNAIAFRRIAEDCGLDEIVPKVSRNFMVCKGDSCTTSFLRPYPSSVSGLCFAIPYDSDRFQFLPRTFCASSHTAV